MIRVVCAFFLVFGMSWLTSAEDAKPVTAILLVARAELPDPNFKDAVVLVLNNIAPVPAGLIVNRPTRITVSSLFPKLERLAKLDDKVYFGGPVEIESVSFLFRANAPPEHATQVVNGVYLSANEELLRKLLDREKPMEGLRIFVGHSGWGPGQLQAEIARGDWTLAPAETAAIFDSKSEHPWPGLPAHGVGPRTRAPQLIPPKNHEPLEGWSRVAVVRRACRSTCVNRRIAGPPLLFPRQVDFGVQKPGFDLTVSLS